VETPQQVELELRDGTPVIARPLVADDRAALAEAYRRVSPEARYNRFWTQTGEVVDEKMLDRVLRQDPDKHVSWTVLDPTHDFSPMAVASWWRDASQPQEAEISLIVLDDDQGRGIGTLLLAIMWLTALDAGLDSIVGHVLTDNQPTADSRQPTADSRQPTADSRQPTADSRQPTADSRQPTAGSRQPA
jgi:GNAT superfamily N-acetyltransferase